MDVEEDFLSVNVRADASTHALAWLADDKLISASLDGGLTEWFVDPSGEAKMVKQTSPSRTGVSALAVSQDKDVIVTSSVSGTFSTRDLASLDAVESTNAGPGECISIALNSAGTRLASTTFNGAVNIWDVKSRELFASFDLYAEGDSHLCVAFCEDKHMPLGRKRAPSP